MKKIFSFLTAVLFAGSMMADSYTITFKEGSGTSSDGSTKVTSVADIIADGASYVSEVATATNVYNARVGRGIKLGASSKAGELTLTLAAPVQATSIVVTARKYNDSEKAFTIQGQEFTAGDGDDFAEYTYTYIAATEISSIALASPKRIYFTSVTVNYGEGGGGEEPTMAYYLVGTNNGWNGAGYQFAANPATEGEYMLDVTFAANDEFKVIGVLESDTTWFPAEANNCTINEAGDYTVYFRPDYQGGQDWYAGCIYNVKHDALPDPTNCAEAAAAALSVSANNELYNNGAVYTITGYVTAIATVYNDNFHNISFWMADAADGGNVLEAYRAACASEADAPVVGDKVAVTGSLTKYNTTPEFAAGCTFEIIEHAAPGEDPVNLGPKTIAEFLELANIKDTCILTGIIDSVVNTQYGNFNLVDATGKVYVYGLLTAAGESKKCYEEENLAAGDTLTIKAIYNLYNNKPQVKNAIFVEVKHAESDVLEDGYYLVSDMNEWTPVADYMLYQNEAAEGEEYMIIMEFAAGEQFKVRKVENGEATTWYPDNAENYTINEEGIYTVYFRPNADGGEGWYHGVIYTEKVQAVELNMTDGQLIVGEMEGDSYAQVDLFNFEQFDEEGRALGDGDWMTLYLFPEGENISGLYSVDEYTMMGEVYRVAGEDTLFVEALSGEASIEVLSIDVENEKAQISVEAALLCENNVIYTVVVELTVDYFYEGEDPTEAIENTKVAVDRNQVIKLIEAGQVVVKKNGVKYSINGQLMK